MNLTDKYRTILKFTSCPVCGSGFTFSSQKLYCKKCERYFSFLAKDIPSLVANTEQIDKFTMDKWNSVFKDNNFRDEAEEVYVEHFLNRTKNQVLEYAGNKKGVFLEMGCGLGFLGEAMAKDGWFFLGVDYSITALKLVKTRLDKRGVKNYLLVHGDVEYLPIKNNSVDLLFGGGVIEHFQNARPVIDNIYRVLKRNGVSFNAIPFFNLGNLIYRSLWGGIPNVPVLKQLSELIHIKILKGKHMIFGYELQLTVPQVKALHLKAGFKQHNMCIDKFDTYIQLHRIKSLYLKKIIAAICERIPLFWPAIKIIAIKN